MIRRSGVCCGLFFVSLLLISSSAPAFFSKKKIEPEMSFSASVEEVSDRQYAPALRDAFLHSRVSIDIGLKAISVENTKDDSIDKLLEDLVDAAKRGVQVRLFVNTFSGNSLENSLFLRDDVLDYLIRQGLEVHFVSPSYEYEDQVVVIDRDTVIEGGPAWTGAGFEKGFGSASLVRSGSFANKKIVRLELLPLWNLKNQKAERVAGAVPVPLFLLQDLKYFPQMVSHEDGDALKLFLALLRLHYESQDIHVRPLFESIAQNLPSAGSAEPGAAEFQTLKALHRLAENYELIVIEKEEPDRAQIKIKLPVSPQPFISVPKPFFDENFAKELSPRAIYTYFLILFRSQETGRSPVWIGSAVNVQQDFPIAPADFKMAADELRRENLIEIFPFPLRKGESYLGPSEKEFRYVINEIPSLSERLEMWSRLREEFNEDDFKRAQELAEVLDEPKDPKVIVTFLNLLESYAFTDVQSITEHVTGLPVQSTPAELEYVRTVLENETKGTKGLGTAP